MSTHQPHFCNQPRKLVHRFFRKPGFSLVEVTMAIGIVSFALVSILGLMPVGLNLFRDTVKDTSSKRIADRLIAEIRDTSWENLKNYAEGSGATGWGYYATKFDMEGDAMDSGNWAFKARADVSSVTGEKWNYPVKLSGNSYIEQNLRKVTISVAYWPDHKGEGENESDGTWVFSPTSAASQRGDVRTYSFLLSNNGTSIPAS